MLQLITHRNPRFDEAGGALEALKGGCRWIQLRMKDATAKEIVEMAHKIAPLCLAYGAKLILDDHVELVRETGAHGVHLGKMDMPVTEARSILGNDYIIGATANTLEDMINATAAGADYIGLGPFRFTETKKKLSPVLGIEGYERIMKQYNAIPGAVPVVAIGGITLDDIEPLMQTGVSGVAVSGTILNAVSPEEITKRIINTLNKYE